MKAWTASRGLAAPVVEPAGAGAGAAEVDVVDDPELHPARNANPMITFRTHLSTSVFVRT
jgi:hypothetical protein